MTRRIRQAVDATLRTRWIGQGPQVDAFEKAISAKFGVKYPVALNSATSALELAYELVGIEKGDEVIVTPYTCTATNIPLLRRGAKLVFVDIDPFTMNMRRDSILQAITKKTKAIVNVNMGGIKSDIGKFGKIPVITDSAQAIGYTNGDYVIYSFQAIKHITTGDGGMLVCPDKKTYKKAKLLRWFGIDRELKQRRGWQAYQKRKMTFDIELPGFKYQMHDIAASMGIEGLKDLDKVLARRKELFETYQKLLAYHPEVQIIDGPENTHWLLTVLVQNRDKFAKKMQQAGIEVNMVHLRNDLYKVFGGKRRMLPVMDTLEEQYICLPLNPHLTLKDVAYICKTIKEGWE